MNAKEINLFIIRVGFWRSIVEVIKFLIEVRNWFCVCALPLLLSIAYPSLPHTLSNKRLTTKLFVSLFSSTEMTESESNLIWHLSVQLLESPINSYINYKYKYCVSSQHILSFITITSPTFYPIITVFLIRKNSEKKLYTYSTKLLSLKTKFFEWKPLNPNCASLRTELSFWPKCESTLFKCFTKTNIQLYRN